MSWQHTRKVESSRRSSRDRLPAAGVASDSEDKLQKFVKFVSCSRSNRVRWCSPTSHLWVGENSSVFELFKAVRNGPSAQRQFWTRFERYKCDRRHQVTGWKSQAISCRKIVFFHHYAATDRLVVLMVIVHVVDERPQNVMKVASESLDHQMSLESGRWGWCKFAWCRSKIILKKKMFLCLPFHPSLSDPHLPGSPVTTSTDHTIVLSGREHKKLFMANDLLDCMAWFLP